MRKLPSFFLQDISEMGNNKKNIVEALFYYKEFFRIGLRDYATLYLMREAPRICESD